MEPPAFREAVGAEVEDPVGVPETDPLAIPLEEEAEEPVVAVLVPDGVLVRVPVVVSLVEVPVEVEEVRVVAVVVAVLSELPVTLNCWDWARIPVFWVESESRLIW